jgi:hypothetical protein
VRPELSQSPLGPRRLLNSWKEIAAYLDVNVRTAQNWEEERGLPVHRLPGRRGRVWADADAIDGWRQSGVAPVEPPPSPPPRRLKRWALAGAALLFALLSALYLRFSH